MALDLRYIGQLMPGVSIAAAHLDRVAGGITMLGCEHAPFCENSRVLCVREWSDEKTKIYMSEVRIGEKVSKAEA